MPIRLKSILSAALLALACGPAHATASFDCSISDKNVTVELQGSLGSGDGAALQIPNGEIKIKAVRGKFDAVEFDMAKGTLAQQWIFEKELRIGFMTDEVKDTSAYLVIIATQGKPKDDLTQWKGRYILKVQGPKGATELKGTIKSCQAG